MVSNEEKDQTQPLVSMSLHGRARAWTHACIPHPDTSKQQHTQKSGTREYKELTERHLADDGSVFSLLLSC